MKKILFALALVILNVGCLDKTQYVSAKTELGGGIFGWKFEDTKNNNVSIKGMEVDPATKAFKCAELTITNNASEVYKAQEGLIKMLTEERIQLMEERKAMYEVLKQFAPAEVLKSLPIKLPI